MIFLMVQFDLGLTYAQGYRARSWVEYSLLKKYHRKFSFGTYDLLTSECKKIFLISARQRRFHFPACDDVLATGSRFGEFSG